MQWLNAIRYRLRALLAKKRLDSRLDEELLTHYEMLVEQNIGRGASPEEARRLARLELGGSQQIKESAREQRGFPLLDSIALDLRYGARMLRKSPGFMFVAILTLALGIGANTAMFTMMNGLLLRTLPVRDPGNLVELLHHYPGEPEPGFNGFSLDAFRIMSDGNHVFSDLFIGSTMNFAPVHAEKLQPQTLFVGGVGGTFFQSLGVGSAAGRLIGPDDVHVGYHAPVAVISWSFWKSRFNLDSEIIGEKIVVGDDPLTIIGVTQRGFYGLNDEAPQDIWFPISLGPGWGASLMARLKPGVSIEQARAEMSGLFQEAVNQPDVGPFIRQMQLRIEPAGNGVTTPLTQMLSTPLKILMATVGLLLLLACANLAGLILARGASRGSEMAVRACLGAARARLLRQTLTESLMLSLAGCAVGVFFAYFAARALVRVFASGRFIVGAPVRFEVLTTPDAHVLLFTAAIALLTGLVCGAAPALRAFRTIPSSSLQQASRIGESRVQRLFAKGLVVSQVAVSLVLLSVGGLFVGYLSNLRSMDTGFRRDRLLLVTLDTDKSGYDIAQFSQRFSLLSQQLSGVPGVHSATLSDVTPMQGPGASGFAAPEGHPDLQKEVSINYVAPKYFETYGTPLLAGREFSEADRSGLPVAIINQAAARECFSGQNPIGQHITLSHVTLQNGETGFEVVGVVGDAKYNELEQAAPSTVYRDVFQGTFLPEQLTVRTEAEPLAVAGQVRSVIASALSPVPIVRVETMNEQIDSAIVPQRLVATLSGWFGALGALLAAIGLYGLLAYTVSRRTHEIGIRMALGASRGDVMRWVLRDALRMVAAGLLIGAPLAFWGNRLAGSLIQGIPSARSLPVIFGALAMVAIALLASYLPARRAMRVDPCSALRWE
jgi:predicted permease